jgi:hydroxyethylthiazole kinase-like uncharacterized protein yjeF
MIPVLSPTESAARDRAAIAGGIPSRALMRSAGMGAAAVIARRHADALRRGVLVFAGPGNNGGDAWVVAGALATAGVSVRVLTAGDPKPGGDAAAERDAARSLVRHVVTDASHDGGNGLAGVVVDGLLGTGSSGGLRGQVADAARQIMAYRARGAIVVALDVPTGVDSMSGEVDPLAVRADLTLTFGSMKRGLLIARGAAGEIAVLDIGLGIHAAGADGAPALVDASFVRAHVPTIRAEWHKGLRRKIAIVGGAPGMAGATILAARAALASGVGLVRLFVSAGNVPVVQTAEYGALAASWPETDQDVAEHIEAWADGVLLGPGLGTAAASRAVADRVLRATRKPMVLDADALNLFAGRAAELGALLAARPALVTPHPAEFGRLAGLSTDEVLAHRFEVGGDLARTLGAAVLLKGVPTVISSPRGERLVSATGTPILAVGGSGDILAGMTATLLAQTSEPTAAGAAGAWVHGRAAELAGPGVRGLTLDSVLQALPEAWRLDETPPTYPVLAQLPNVGE